MGWVPLRLRPHPGAYDRAEASCLAFSRAGGDPLSRWALDLRLPTQPGPMWCVPHPDPMEMVLRPPVSLQPQAAFWQFPAPCGTGRPGASMVCRAWRPPASRGPGARLLAAAILFPLQPSGIVAGGPRIWHTGVLDLQGSAGHDRNHQASSQEGQKDPGHRPGLIRCLRV